MKYKIHTRESVLEREVAENYSLSKLLMELCNEYGYGYAHDRQYVDISLDPGNVDTANQGLLCQSIHYDIHLSSEAEVDVESLVAELPGVNASWYVTGLSVTIKNDAIEELTINYQNYYDITEFLKDLTIP